ncbi:MAG TPA: hypothetical protein VIO11_06750 [Candidatus Methanoperedens sp.]
MTLEIRLIKEMGYERISCACGMAVLPRDPSPEISKMVERVASEACAKFSIVDVWVHPAVLEEYKISELPAVIIGKKSYPTDEVIIREALRKQEYE